MDDVIGRATAVGQGAFWLGTGIWPLAHYPSFEAVTGRKKDDWLVKTMGGLIAAVGVTLLRAGWRGRVTADTALLGLAGAAALSWADLHFVRRGRISGVYLLDVLAEAPFLLGWAARGLLRRRGPGPERPPYARIADSAR